MRQATAEFNKTESSEWKIGLRSLSGFSEVLLLVACSCALTFAQTKPKPVTVADPETKACAEETCAAYCQQQTVPKTSVGQCVSECKKSCALPKPPPQPPPVTVTVTPKYKIMAIAYAPPGCTTGPAGTPVQCGTSNGSSFVDYGSSSSNGTKTTTASSFQLGLTITYSASFLGALNGGGSYGFQNTTSNSSSVDVTKSTTNDWKVLGNGDGIDHGQDQFFLLLNPQVTVQKNGSQIKWGFSDPGSPYTVYASELQNPSTMRPSTAQVFKEVGLTTDDYQSILNADPFGGTVVTASNIVPLPRGGVASTGFSGSASGSNAAPGSNLDQNRFWYTGLSFPYQPGLSGPGAQACNSDICNCDSYAGSMSNDKAGDTINGDQGETTVDLQGGASLPLSQTLKIDAKMVWTDSSTTDNSTDKKETATATVTCPSTKYQGPFGIQAWWDSRYGSFVLILYDPGAVPMIQKGRVTNASGQPVRGQLVTMIYKGKTHSTYTANDGSYGFPSWSGAPAFTGTAEIDTGSLKQTVNLGNAEPIELKMK